MDKKEQQNITICSETVKKPHHICAFFSSREEQYQILLPWLKEGIDKNEEVFTILSKTQHDEHCSRMSNSGIPVQDAITNKQLKVIASEDSYLQGGCFAAERMFNIVNQALVDAQTGPYGTFRGYGDMEWALKNLPGTDELMEYEARLNFIIPKHDCSVLCCYDINRFSENALVDILATHPYVIMNGKVHRNPHYIQPVEFLGDLIKRPRRPLATNSKLISDKTKTWNLKAITHV